jgi:hypothetical protein
MGNANNTLTLQVLLREARNAHKNVVEIITTKIAELRARVSRISQSVAEENSKYHYSRVPLLFLRFSYIFAFFRFFLF